MLGPFVYHLFDDFRGPKRTPKIDQKRVRRIDYICCFLKPVFSKQVFSTSVLSRLGAAFIFCCGLVLVAPRLQNGRPGGQNGAPRYNGSMFYMKNDVAAAMLSVGSLYLPLCV